MRKSLIFILSISLVWLQYRLWQGQGSIIELKRLRQVIAQGQSNLLELEKRNARLEVELQILKKNPKALEERARAELGMIKEGETFCLVVEPAR
jgi:cell division protein FtsB